MTQTILSNSLLRAGLLGDAAASAAMGLLLVTAPLAGLLALPEPLLRGAGWVLLPYAALVAWMGVQPRLPRWAVRGVVGVNLLWAADSVVLLGFVSPNGLGTSFVLGQAAVVAGFAALQWAGMRQRAARHAAVPA